MRGDQYEGKLCNHGHDTGNGTSIRYVATKHCVACSQAHAIRYRDENTEKFKQYNAEYYQMLKKDKKWKLDEYLSTQIERGHRNYSKPKPNDSQ